MKAHGRGEGGRETDRGLSVRKAGGPGAIYGGIGGSTRRAENTASAENENHFGGGRAAGSRLRENCYGKAMGLAQGCRAGGRSPSRGKPGVWFGVKPAAKQKGDSGRYCNKLSIKIDQFLPLPLGIGGRGNFI